MQSIRTKILSSFLFVIASLFIVLVYLVILHFTIVGKYQYVVDNMTSEYKIITTTSRLVKSYNEVSKNPTDLQKSQEYDKTHAELLALVQFLDSRISSPDSRRIFTGLKNTIQSVLTECDSGQNAAKKGIREGLSEHYAVAFSRNEYVQQNTSSLILSELEYMSVIEKQIAQTHAMSLVIGFIILFLITIICITYAQVLSTNLVTPLQKLALLTKTIAEGDLSVDVDAKLLTGKDEVASLAHSFTIMIKNLRENIRQITDSKNIIAEAQKGVEAKNEELEKINKFMVNRELKMVELKQQNDELKKQLGIPSTP